LSLSLPLSLEDLQFYLQVAKSVQPQWSLPASAGVEECYTKARREENLLLKGVCVRVCVYLCVCVCVPFPASIFVNHVYLSLLFERHLSITLLVFWCWMTLYSMASIDSGGLVLPWSGSSIRQRWSTAVALC
jgi:hypothetical protein